MSASSTRFPFETRSATLVGDETQSRRIRSLVGNWLLRLICCRPDRIDASISRKRLVAILDDSKVKQQDNGWRAPLTIATSPDQRERNLKVVLGSPPSQQLKVAP
jgi:hypothetical protein